MGVQRLPLTPTPMPVNTQQPLIDFPDVTIDESTRIMLPQSQFFELLAAVLSALGGIGALRQGYLLFLKWQEQRLKNSAAEGEHSRNMDVSKLQRDIKREEQFTLALETIADNSKAQREANERSAIEREAMRKQGEHQTEAIEKLTDRLETNTKKLDTGFSSVVDSVTNLTKLTERLITTLTERPVNALPTVENHLRNANANVMAAINEVQVAEAQQQADAAKEAANAQPAEAPAEDKPKDSP